MSLYQKGLVNWLKISLDSTRMSQNLMFYLILNIMHQRLFWRWLRWQMITMILFMIKAQNIQDRVANSMKQILNLWNLLRVGVIMMKLIWREGNKIYIIKLVASLKLIKLKEIEPGWRLVYLLLHQIKLIWLQIKLKANLNFIFEIIWVIKIRKKKIEWWIFL